MIFRAYNTGLSVQNMPDGYQAQEGDILFDHFPTSDELTSAFPGYAAAAAQAAAEAQGASQVQAVLANGLAIVSTGTPALNGTYAIDAGAQQNISGIAAGIGSRNRLPGGGATFDYGDITTALHAFTGPQFLDFAAAVEDYLYALLAGTIPPQPVTIA